MRVYVLGSGSGGNALLVDANGTRVLVEAGLGPRIVAARLAELGVDLAPGELDGIVATHEHGDHFGHAAQLAAAFGAPLYLHAGIDAPAADVTVHRYPIGRAFRVGGLAFASVHVPHDVMQVALRVDDGVRALGVATDVGRVTNDLVALLAECDAALLEANHCAEMLAFSDYPDVVKRRVGGGLGHLSNAQAAELAARLVGSRLARLWLGHLSRTNNSPARALDVVAARARRIDVSVLPDATPIALDVHTTRPHQLGLPFG
ncbi:MAG: MBL fold metallo-hydrolase [Labilithrix sp.]|nr:MBL fold metallo-hydrolase [Labilithrix sp.]MCW5814260.1 MBL fold metallo-hydrolase [Labilithrix sp.]